MVKGSYISDTLMVLGVPTNISGYKYLKDAVGIFLNSEGSNRVSICSDVYDVLSEKYYGKGSSSKIERCIRYAVRICMSEISEDELHKVFKGDSRRITNSRFISSVSEYIRMEELKHEQENTY